MAFVVEDGTGLVDATSGVSVEYALAYYADRGMTGFPTIEASQQQALVKATDYIEARFGQLFRDEKLNPVQALSVPFKTLGIPDKYKRAVCEYALRSAVSPLMPDPEKNTVGVKRYRTKVDVIEKEIEYLDGGNPYAVYPVYPLADALLDEFIGSVNQSRTYR